MKPQEIVDKMMAKDAFSQWLGISIITIEEGFCELKSEIRPEMVNGFGICHGGVTFSIADSAFAFASNSRGQHAVSIETSISHLHPAKVGDIIHATVTEKSNTSRLARYEVILSNQNNINIAIFNGTVFKKDAIWQ
jgi:acyl-CoA thioesterase